MLAEKNETIKEAAATMYAVSAEENIRLQCEARERYERDQRSIYAAGKLEGKQEGKLEGLQNSIEICKDCGISQDITVTKIMEKYSLSLNDATAYVQKYW